MTIYWHVTFNNKPNNRHTLARAFNAQIYLQSTLVHVIVVSSRLYISNCVRSYVHHVDPVSHTIIVYMHKTHQTHVHSIHDA